jgi:thiamine biosynthesis lipoprotein
MPERWRETVHAMGMPFRVTVDGPSEPEEPGGALRAFHAELVWADDVFSLWRDDSYLSHFHRGEITLDEAPPELLEVLQACEWYRSATDGAFDARGPDGLDPTGLVKGWAVVRAARALDGIGQAWMVDASGDILVSGTPGKTWRVGIADPRVQGDPDGTAAVDVVELGPHARALATSGTAQRGAHIWDPATGAPARHVLQASVVGESLVDADVWATAIVAGGLDVLPLATAAGMEALVVIAERPDGSFDTMASDEWPSLA